MLDVCNAPEFVLSLALGFADDGVTGNSEFQRREIMTRTPSAEVGDLLPDAFGRISMHQVGIALFGNQFLGGRGFASRVQGRPRLGHGLGIENVIFHTVILSGKRKMVLLPHAVENVEPFAGARVAVVVLFERHAIFAGLIGPPR